MSYAFIITVVAASVGLLSGLWLCYPTAAQNPHSLAWVASPPYKSVEGITSIAIDQSAQYSVGGMFLVVAFFLQVIGAIAPQTLILMSCSILQCNLYLLALIVVFLSLVFFAPLSFVIFNWRVKVMHRQVKAAAEHLKEFPRHNPLP